MASIGGQAQGRANGSETLQNTSTFESAQSSSGFNMSLCIPPICYGVPVTATVSLSNQAIDHNYISAVGQSGIAAGKGGFDIAVAGNTDLKGAAITSSATQDKNKLQTASLTSTDLQNQQNTSSSSSSITVGNDMAAMALGNLMANLGGKDGLPQNGSQSGQTLSVISPATVSITGTGNASTDAASATQIATLTSRDASTANGSLKNTLTLQQAAQLEEKQKTAQENLRAANLAGAAMDGMIGDLGYAPGSAQATILHGISGMAQASLSGTNVGTGFVAGALNEQLVQPMSNYIGQNCTSCVVTNKDGTPQKDVDGNLVLNQQGKDLLLTGSALVGAGATAALGGSKVDVGAGAGIAKNSTEFNFLDPAHQSALNKKLQALRTYKDQNFIQNLLNSTDVQGAAQEVSAVQYIDRRSNDLLAIWRQSPGTLSDKEKNELAVYVGAYANGYGVDAANRLLKNGPEPSMQNSDVGSLTQFANSLLQVNGVQQGQSAIGTPALAVLAGPVGNVVRLVQVAQSSTQIGAGYAAVNDGDTSAGFMNIGLGVLGLVPTVAMQASIPKPTGVLASSEVRTIGANGGVNPTLLNELTANGVKFTPENVIATARSPSGQVVFLETGSPAAGLRHIVQEHGPEFASMGVSEAQIPSVVMRAVTEGKIVGYQGSGTGRPIYELTINGQTQRIAITTSNNGFIVGANPRGTGK